MDGSTEVEGDEILQCSKASRNLWEVELAYLVPSLKSRDQSREVRDFSEPVHR